MANNGVTTKLQKEMSMLQEELSQLHVEIDSKINSWLKDFNDTIKDEICTELHSLFEQYFGQNSSSTVVETSLDKGKGILRSPPSRIPSKEHLTMSPLPDP
ncbi:hypothetical protein J1N35_033476 [Gossypium stocksii]|uniref:Uncharacterized protein n=1 Tax=Gossypium stocksii TaxID=47602 RepID=A0A9D3UQ44_9ROSI|nr:hypothetical protein J1N35_033476 [Gossypium stocksii]